MDKQNLKLSIAGKFYTKHYRDGNRIDASGNIIDEDKVEESGNIFINEGLIYALNAGFGVSVGGAPTPITTFYIGLSTANRTWTALDKADDSASAGIHTVGLEFEGYTVTAGSTQRPPWAPAALATRPSTILLSDSGAEATYDITSNTTVYGAFMIDEILKDGSGDTSASTLVAGSNFTSPRALEINDVFKVGYVLTASSAP